MKQKEKNDFTGFLNFKEDDQWIIYPFNIQNYNMTVLSPGNNGGHLDTIEPGGWFFGVDEDNHDVAFNCNNVVPHISIRGTVKKYSYSIPVIVKSNNNGSYEDLTLFDGLCFTGGAINYLYPPQKAFYYDEESNSIRFYHVDKYRRSLNVMLKGGAVKVTLSINTGNARGFDLISNNLGTINSCIYFEFDNPRSINDIALYQDLIQNFVSFCMGQSNTGIQTQMLKKDTNKYLANFASCWFNYGHNDIARKNLMSVIRLDLLDDDKVASLLQLFDDEKTIPYLEMLPSSNHGVNLIRAIDICMLCTALEREYCKHYFNLDEDKKLTAFKEKLLVAVKQAESEIDNINEKYINSIKFNINNLSSPSEKSRITILYERYREHMLPICERYIDTSNYENDFIPKVKEAISKIYTIEEFSTAIRKFVDLRNEITHKGIFDWNDRAKIYAHLYLIFCFSVLERAGVPLSEASNNLSFLFSKDFWA